MEEALRAAQAFADAEEKEEAMEEALRVAQAAAEAEEEEAAMQEALRAAQAAADAEEEEEKAARYAVEQSEHHDEAPAGSTEGDEDMEALWRVYDLMGGEKAEVSSESAAKVQAAFRGKKERAETAVLRRQKTEGGARTQAAFRGRRARKDVDGKPASHTEVPARPTATPPKSNGAPPGSMADVYERCKQVFTLLDKNGDGILSRIEIIQACRKDERVATLLRIPQQIRQEDGSRDAFETMFQSMDDDDSKAVSLDEFQRWWLTDVVPRLGTPWDETQSKLEEIEIQGWLAAAAEMAAMAAQAEARQKAAEEARARVEAEACTAAALAVTKAPPPPALAAPSPLLVETNDAEVDAKATPHTVAAALQQTAVRQLGPTPPAVGTVTMTMTTTTSFTRARSPSGSFHRRAELQSHPLSHYEQLGFFFSPPENGVPLKELPPQKPPPLAMSMQTTRPPMNRAATALPMRGQKDDSERDDFGHDELLTRLEADVDDFLQRLSQAEQRDSVRHRGRDESLCGICGVLSPLRQMSPLRHTPAPLLAPKSELSQNWLPPPPPKSPPRPPSSRGHRRGRSLHAADGESGDAWRQKARPPPTRKHKPSSNGSCASGSSSPEKHARHHDRQNDGHHGHHSSADASRRSSRGHASRRAGSP